MARLRRLVLPGHPHLVCLRALETATPFADDQDCRAWLDALKEASKTRGVDVHAFALTDRAAFLVVTPTQGPSLARLVQDLGRRYVSAHHRRYGGRGTLWEGRYRAAPVEPGAPTLLALAWVDGLGDGRPECSSRGHRDGRARQSWLVDPAEYWRLGNTPFEREAAWQACLGAGPSADQVRALEQAVLGGWAFGSPGFVHAAALATGRPAAPRPRGRPRRPA